MTTEFTGERVVPGQVNADLWNEHFARYAFAARLASNRRVLDAGCGAGYGSAELARVAAQVTGVDVAPDAVALAHQQFSADNLTYLPGSCTDLPFPDASFDLIVSFEVIEHLADWPRLICEARRLLAEGGQFVVSTPNKSFYAETRGETGPNPFHEHEFEYAEFVHALSELFPRVAVYLQDRVEAMAFVQAGKEATAEARIEHHRGTPEQSNFFIAVCSVEPVADLPGFLYVPRTANALAEKLIHIQRLEGEVATKDHWIEQEQAAHQELLAKHADLHKELVRRNVWANDLAAQLKAAQERIVALQSQLGSMADGYEAQVANMHRELQERTRWGAEIEERLTAELLACIADRDRQTAELGRCVELLQQAEKTVEERTQWALSLDEQRTQLAAAVSASRWHRLGRALGLGPELEQR